MEYLFRCSDCNWEFLIKSTYNEVSGIKPQCPACGSLKTTRRYTPIRAIFKGSGFYTTDTRINNE